MPQGPEARIRAAVQANPRKMTLQLARELGVPDVDVIRAFPSQRAVELDIARWEELIRSFEDLGVLRVIVSNGCGWISTKSERGGDSAKRATSLSETLRTVPWHSRPS